MREDRLRALRALRFAARFGFAIEPATWKAIVGSSAHLGRLSPERVKQEIEKTIIQVAAPSAAFALWRDSGAFRTLIPSLAGVSDIDLRAIDCVAIPGAGSRASDRRLLRVALLFAPTGPIETARSVKALRFSNQEGAWVTSVIERWARTRDVLTEMIGAGVMPGAAVRRWVSTVGRLRVRAVMRVAAARWHAERAAGKAAPTPRAASNFFRLAVRSAFHDPVEIADLAVDGDDLRRAGFAPGPLMGQTLQALLEWVLEEPARNTRDSLIAHASKLQSSLGSAPQ
jgi:tRNA nucleotidyltransferase (CCA-adding enzyme)